MTQLRQAIELLKRMSVMPFEDNDLRFDVLEFLDGTEQVGVETPGELMNAVEFLLRESRCGYNREGHEVFTFEQDSEIHAVLVEAVEQARASTSCDVQADAF